MPEILTEVIDRYGNNKAEMDKYKKLCDVDNTFIKTAMLEDNMENYATDNYTAKITTVDKGYFDEPKVLSVIHSYNIPNSLGIIKTKEYIDEDALEAAIYNGELSKEVIDKIAECKVEKTEYRLSVRKKKGE